MGIPSSGAGGHLNAWHPLGLVLRVNGVRAGSSAKQISDPTRRWDNILAGWAEMKDQAWRSEACTKENEMVTGCSYFNIANCAREDCQARFRSMRLLAGWVIHVTFLRGGSIVSSIWYASEGYIGMNATSFIPRRLRYFGEWAGTASEGSDGQQLKCSKHSRGPRARIS